MAKQTAKEIIAANVKSLIEHLEAEHCDALTAYLDAMSRFHQYSIGNVPEIARQKPDATRVAGMYAWNQVGRRLKMGEKGIRILAPIIGVKRRPKEEAEKDITKQNRPVLVGVRPMSSMSPKPRAELPAMREIHGDVREKRDRLLPLFERQGIERVFTENIAPERWRDHRDLMRFPARRLRGRSHSEGVTKRGHLHRVSFDRPMSLLYFMFSALLFRETKENDAGD